MWLAYLRKVQALYVKFTCLYEACRVMRLPLEDEKWGFTREGERDCLTSSISYVKVK